ncbi:MAG: hypothetical protein P8P37_02330 [Candidatus Marinimicrobia bacterium]|nr:hypothetical protein [Candidatus Neomarinimicrobiota bacterium]
MYKYKTFFSSEIQASSIDNNNTESISKASLQSLKSLMPEGIDLEGNIDLIAVAFNAAVVNVFNKNHDGINTETAKAVYKYFVNKPTNIEHKKQKVVGHIISSGFSKYGTNEILEVEDIEQSYEPFNIALSALVYKTVNPEFADLIEKSSDENDPMHNVISASWEIGFNDYAIAVGSKNLKEAEIVTEEKQKEELKKYLKAFDGDGLMDDGTEIYRLVAGDVYPLGIGFTTNPAANVKGTIQLDKKKAVEEDQIKNEEKAEKIEVNFDNFLKKIINIKKNSSHTEKTHVISDKPNLIKTVQKMETQELIDQLKETILASSSDKFSEEAVANIVKVVSDAIREKSDVYVQEKADLETQRQEVEAAKVESEKKLIELEEKLTASEETLSKIQAEQDEARKLQLFNDRMSSLDEEYELSDDDRKILASEVSGVEEGEEAFATYQEKIAIVFKHKNKSFIEEQEKTFNEKVLAEVEKRMSNDIEAHASEEVAEVAEEISQEVVEEVLEQIESSEDIPSNNGESTEKDLSLADKFKSAFNKESITIKY